MDIWAKAHKTGGNSHNQKPGAKPPCISIVFILPTAHGGGAEKVLLTLANNISRSKFRLHLILVDASGPNLSMIPPDVNAVCLGYRHVSRALPSIIGALRKIRPDVVLSSIGHLNLAMIVAHLFLRNRTKVIVRESNVPSISFSGTAKLKLIALLYPFLYPFADRILCPGSGVRSDLQKSFKINARKMVVVPNPVSVKAIRSAMVYVQCPWGERRPRLLAAGRMTAQKGFDLLIKAMKLIVAEVADAHLIILGDGPQRDDLLRLVETTGLSNNVTLGGYQKNAYPYYHQADLFILSSRYEGLPNVVLESLACGTPVVAFDCPGSLKDILQKPQQGTLVPPENISALANSIMHRLKNGLNPGKQSLLPPKFHLENVVSQYEQLFLQTALNETFV
jgi:glycosyltransferase involved in cell wall biosynthesis